MKQKADLSFLKDVLPNRFTRKQAEALLKQYYPIKLSARTMANLDALGQGVRNREISGKSVIYRRKYYIEFLERRTQIVR